MRIFVSVGTHPQPFDRLLRQLDKISAQGKHEIFAQTGNCTYKPKNFPSKGFLDQQQYQKMLKQAGLVISHGGAGTIINSMLHGKKVIVVPRLQGFNEHTNDHQVDLAEALAAEGKVIAVGDMRDLGKAIEKAKSFKPNLASNKENLVREISEFLEAN